MDDIPEYERKKIIKEIDDSKDYQIQVGEKLLYILDNCYDHINAQNASKLFAAMIRRKISYSQFLGAAQVIARISPDELEQFLGSYEYRSIDSSAMNLIHTGLLFSEVSEIEVEVDLNKVEQGDWDDPPEHYEAETNTDGGELVLHPTASGDVIFEVFGIGKDALRKNGKKNGAARVKILQKNMKEANNPHCFWLKTFWIYRIAWRALSTNRLLWTRVANSNLTSTKGGCG